MATVHVDVEPMITHISRYQAGPGHSYLRPATEPGRQVTVEIGALGSSIDIDPLTGPQGFRVIGTMENKDARYTEAEFGLKPRTRYLIWVAPGPLNSPANSRTRWGLLEYPRTRTGVLPSQPKGYVLWCANHANPPGTPSDVDFKDLALCTVNVGVINLPGPRPWARCATGCCYYQSSF